MCTVSDMGKSTANKHTVSSEELKNNHTNQDIFEHETGWDIYCKKQVYTVTIQDKMGGMITLTYFVVCSIQGHEVLATHVQHKPWITPEFLF